MRHIPFSSHRHQVRKKNGLAISITTSKFCWNPNCLQTLKSMSFPNGAPKTIAVNPSSSCVWPTPSSSSSLGRYLHNPMLNCMVLGHSPLSNPNNNHFFPHNTSNKPQHNFPLPSTTQAVSISSFTIITNPRISSLHPTESETKT